VPGDRGNKVQAKRKINSGRTGKTIKALVGKKNFWEDLVQGTTQ